MSWHLLLVALLCLPFIGCMVLSDEKAPASAADRTTKDGKRPRGRPTKHSARWIASRLKDNGLDGRTGPAKLLKLRADEIAEDAGGWPHLTNRESVLVRRTAALLLLCETIEHYVFTQQSPFTEAGELLAVLAKNYISYSNTVRLNLLALGLKPDRGDKVPSLAEYLERRALEAAAEREAADNGHADPESGEHTEGQATASPAAEPAAVGESEREVNG